MNQSELIILILHMLENKRVIDFGERIRIEEYLAGKTDLDFHSTLGDILKLLD